MRAPAGERILHGDVRWPGRAQTVLLACGVIAPLVYLASDAIAGLRWDGYSFRDQTISELNAIGSPSRSLTIALGLAGYACLTAFGAGVWRAARTRRGLRLAGGALAAFGLLSLWAVPFASMHVRGAERGLGDTLHLVDGAAAGLLFAVALGGAAASFRTRFRIYSVATLLVVLGFAAWSGMDGARIADGLATPWVGVKERVSVYAYQAWFVALALTLLRETRGVTRAGRA
jgi:hypothetical protein